MFARPQIYPQEPQPTTVRSWRLLVCIYVALAGGTLAVFAGVARHEFVEYDDDEMIYENPWVNKGLTLDGVKFAFTGPHVGNWHPLTTLSHMLDCQWFGIGRPGLHHLMSLILHAASAVLLFEALRRMTGELWPSALVSALFAVHPLRVESVAWAAERKDVLSVFFFMLTLLVYAAYARTPTVRRYLVVCVTLGLGLMAKAMLVTLPFVLLMLDVWPLRRWRAATASANDALTIFPPQPASRLILEKLPWLAAALVVALANVLVQRDAEVFHPSITELPVAWRLVNTAMAYVFYLWKTVWPSGLAVLYPHPGLASHPQIGPWIVPATGAALLLLCVTIGATWQGCRRPYLAVGWYWYLGMLFPVIGLFQVGSQAYADRYSYLPMIGIYLAIAFAARDLIRRYPGARYPVALCSLIWLLSLMVVTRNQVDCWRDSRTLYEHALSKTKENSLIHNNLGKVLADQGHIEEAVTHFQEAVRIKSNFALACYNWGVVLERQQRFEEAVSHYQDALRIKPDYAAAHNNCGNALQDLSRLQEAIRHHQEALRIKPDYAEAHNNWGLALEMLGRIEEAVMHYHKALQIKPDYAEAHYNWGNALKELERPQEAVSHYQDALRIRPDYAEAHNNWGNALRDLGRFEEAVARFEEALRIKPNLAEAHLNLGNALHGLGRFPEAMPHYQEGLRLKPDSPEDHNNLGTALQYMGRHQEALTHHRDALRFKPDYAEAHYNWGNALRGLGRSEEAVTHYQDALRIKPDYAEAHNNLGTALQALGRFEEAVAHYQDALRIKPDYAEPHYNWGSGLVTQGRFDEAVAHFQEALRIKPHYAKAHYNCGVVLAKQGRLQDAITHFEHAVRLKPDYKNARDMLRKVQALLEQRNGPARGKPMPND